MLINQCRPDSVLCVCQETGARMRRTDEFVSHGTTCVYTYLCRSCGARVNIAVTGPPAAAETVTPATRRTSRTRTPRTRTGPSDFAVQDVANMTDDEWRAYCKKRGVYDDLRFLHAVARANGQDWLVADLDERIGAMVERGKVTPADRRFQAQSVTRWRRAVALRARDRVEVDPTDYWAKLPRVWARLGADA